MVADVARTATTGRRRSRTAWASRRSSSTATRRYGHSGRLLGFRAVVRWLPAERVAIAVLTNQSRTDPTIIARSLLRLALQPSRAAASTAASRSRR